MRQESMGDLQQGTMGQNQTQAAALWHVSTIAHVILLEVIKHEVGNETWLNY